MNVHVLDPTGRQVLRKAKEIEKRSKQLRQRAEASLRRAKEKTSPGRP